MLKRILERILAGLGIAAVVYFWSLLEMEMLYSSPYVRLLPGALLVGGAYTALIIAAESIWDRRERRLKEKREEFRNLRGMVDDLEKALSELMDGVCQRPVHDISGEMIKLMTWLEKFHVPCLVPFVIKRPDWKSLDLEERRNFASRLTGWILFLAQMSVHVRGGDIKAAQLVASTIPAEPYVK